MIELLWGTESIEKFLQNITDQEYPISGFNVPPKSSDGRVIFLDPRTPQDQGPHGRINDEIHGRVGPSCSSTPRETQ